MKINIKILIAFLTTFVLGSCNLDLAPDGQIDSETAFRSFQDAQKFANGMSAQFRNSLYGVFSLTPEIQTDMYNASQEFGNRNGSIHRMDADFTSGEYTTRDIWRQCYNAITPINTFLEKIDAVTDLTTAEAAQVEIYKGEAYFYRAYLYHILIRFYAKDYDPSLDATAATSRLGVPLLLKMDVTAKPARATIFACYEQIVDDITKAKTALATVSGTLRAERPTIDAAKALDARVNLYMHKFPEAAAVAQELIASGKYNLATTDEAMTAEWVNDNGTEDIMQMFATITENGACLQGSTSANTALRNNVYLGFSNSLNKYQPDFIPTKTALDMYSATDIRYKNWFAEFTCYYNAANYQLVLLNKYPGNPILYTAPNRTYAHKAKVFRIAEMYLIRAEALLSQPAPDAAGALTTLNALQSARAATPTAATMDNVKKEWAKETIGEGFRLDCLRRWNMGFSKRVPQNTSTIMVGTYYDLIEVPANTKYFVWPIPAYEMQTNENLVPNW